MNDGGTAFARGPALSPREAMSKLPITGRAPRTSLAAVSLALLLVPLAARANSGLLLPPAGPYGAVASPFVPAVPGAAEAVAADYLLADGRHLGALLAVLPGPGYDAGAALAAFAGGTPGAARPVVLHGHPLTLVTVARPGEAPVYAVAFAVSHADGQVTADAAEGDVHVVAWAEAEEAATALAAAALDHLSASVPLALARDVPAVAAFTAAPNPFAGGTTLRFTLTAPAEVAVSVYDVLGRRVAALVPGRLGAGLHALPFEADALAPGAYVVRLTAGAAVATQRVTRR